MEGNAAGGKLLMQAADFGRVTVRDRAIGADEEKNDRLRLTCCEWINLLAAQVEQAQLCACASARRASRRHEYGGDNGGDESPVELMR